MRDVIQVFRRRLLAITVGLLLWGLLISARLVEFQVVRADALKERSTLNHRYQQEIPAKRGDIVDCRGQVLAISQVQPSICADPSAIEDANQVVEAIGAILGKGPKWKRSVLSRLSDRDRSFAYVARWVSPNDWESVKSLGFRGVFRQMEPIRKYPKDWLASHVVGFTSLDGSVKEGGEKAFDDFVAGQPGRLQTYRDGRQKKIWLGPRVLKEPVMGATVELTLDQNIQFFVEEALRRALKKTKAANITAIVMDPNTGAIRAMANMPDFNPNFYFRYSSRERKNRAIVDVYEPASAFKIITVAAGLEAQTIFPDQVFDCERGGIRVNNTFIRDHHPYDALTVSEILWKSSNVGAIKIASTYSREHLYRTITKFGFGQKTGIDLPAESVGIVHPVDEWSKVSPAFLAIGHEISTTPLQVLRAASVIANGGYLVQPHVGQRVLEADGRVHELAPPASTQAVFSARTIAIMKEMLEGVVLYGTAKSAAIPGVRVFGKTGTAQRLSGGSYSNERFNASFVGFFPVEQPRYGIIVVVHDPKGGKTDGGDVAAPIFSEIGRQIVLYESELPGFRRRRLPVNEHQRPDWPATPMVELDNLEEMPDLRGLGLRNALYLGMRVGLKVEVNGSGRVVDQEPKPGVAIKPGAVCRLRLGEV